MNLPKFVTTLPSSLLNPTSYMNFVLVKEEYKMIFFELYLFLFNNDNHISVNWGIISFIQ